MDLGCYRDKPVLVTGAGGFVGSRLCAHLLELRASVTALVKPDRDYPRLDGLAVRREEADLVDGERVAEVMNRIQPRVVFHLAVCMDRGRGLKSLHRLMENNIRGSLNLFRSAASVGCEMVVNTGTSEEYGQNAPPFKENRQPDPLTPFAASKATATIWARALHRSLGLNCVTARLFLIYGPGQPDDSFLAQLLRAQANGTTLAMTAGEQTRDFTYVDDAVTALLHLGCRPELGGQIFNVCTGHETSLKQAVEIFSGLVEPPPKVELGALPYRESELFRVWGSPYSLHGAVGFKPKTTLAEGLRMMLEARPS